MSEQIKSWVGKNCKFAKLNKKAQSREPLDLAFNSEEGGVALQQFTPIMNEMMLFAKNLSRDNNETIRSLANSIESSIHYRTNSEDAQQYKNSLFKATNDGRNLLAELHKDGSKNQITANFGKILESYIQGFNEYSNKLRSIADGLMS